MARFFKAPVVQPMDYGFKMPFAEIMGAVQQKQKAHDTTLAAIGALPDDPANALSPDYHLQQGIVSGRESRLDAIMYDENGNLQDLSGKGGLVQAEARKRAREKMSGGTQWATEGSQTKYDDYNTTIDKMLKEKSITNTQAKFLKEKSFWDYAQKGGLGKPTGFGGKFSEQQLFKGLEAAAQVDIGALGEKFGNHVGETTLQTAGAIVNPKTGRVEGLDKDFIPKDGHRFRQTGTLMTVAYEKVYNAVAQGLVGDQSLDAYLRQEAEAEAWGQGMVVSKEGIDQHVTRRMHEEADRAAQKFMRDKFNPKVYTDWKAKLAKQDVYKKGRIDYEMNIKQRVFQGSVATQQVVVDPAAMTETKKVVTNQLNNVTDAISMYVDENGKLKKEFEGNVDAVNDLKRLKKEKQKHQIELDGIKQSEDLLLAETGQNDATMAMTAVNNIINTKHFSPNMGTALNTYILTGNQLGAEFATDAEKAQLEVLIKQMELYADDPKKLGRIMTPAMQERAKEVLSNNLPAGLKAQIKDMPLLYAEGATNEQILSEELSNEYNTIRDKGIKESAEVVNKSGGLNYQTNVTGVQSMDTDTKSDLAALETVMTDYFTKTSLNGLIVSGGDQAGLPATRELFLKGYPGYKVVGDLEFNMARENNDKTGHGGKQQYVVTATLEKDGVKTKKQLVMTTDPTANNNISAKVQEASMQMMNSVVDDLSRQASQDKWALASAFMGGNTPLVESMFDQGIAQQSTSSDKTYVDAEGRPLIGASRTSNNTWVFYHPVEQKDGSYKIDWGNEKTMIKDTRANFGVTNKTEWDHISDFQELVGEKTYEGNLNPMGISTLRTLYNQ